MMQSDFEAKLQDSISCKTRGLFGVFVFKATIHLNYLIQQHDGYNRTSGNSNDSCLVLKFRKSDFPVKYWNFLPAF